jgi:hypothetical protein
VRVGLLQDIIRRITVHGEAVGVDELAAKLRAVGKAQDDVTLATTLSEKAMLSLQGKIGSLEKSLDAEYRAEKQLEAALKTINAARAQGIITAGRQAELSVLAADKFRVEGESAAKAAEGMKLLKEVSGSIAAGFGAGVLFAGVAELPAKIKESVEAAANLKDTAETIGITAKALQELNYAGSQNGVSTDTMSQALAKFSTNLGVAATGTGKLNDVLKANHVAITGDVQKDFENYANLIKDTTNAEQKNYLTTIAFGKSAQDMGRIFNEGADGIRRLGDEANNTGQILSDQTLKSAKEIDDEFAKIQGQLAVTFEDFSITIAPALLFAMRGIATAAEDLRDALNGIKVGNLEGLLKLVQNATHYANPVAVGADIGDAISGALGLHQVNSITVRGGTGAKAQDRDGFVDPVKPTITPSTSDASAANALKAYDRLIESSEKRVLSLHNEADALTATGLAAETMRTYSDLLNQAVATGVSMSPDRVKKLYEEADAIAKAQEALAGAQLNKADASPFDAMGAKVDALNEKLSHGAISWRTYTIEVGKANEAMVTDYAASANDVISNLENLTNALGVQGKQAFEIHKALSIAKAVVSGGEAIVHSYNAGSALPGGPVTGAIFAGIAAAATAAQIASIASTSYSSKSPIGSTGGGSAGAASAAAPAPQQSQAINLTIRGSGNVNVDDLVKQIATEIKDGGHGAFVSVVREVAAA